MICLVRIAGSIMFVWCNGIYHVCLVYCFDFCSILSYSHYAIYHFMGLYNFRDCLMYRFGVCLVYRLRLSWSYSIVWCTICLFGVPFTSVVVILDCMVYHVFVWCTVYVCRGHTRMCGIPCVCLVYRLRLSWSYSIVWCTMCLFGVPFRLSWSYSIVWCTMCLFGVPFTSVVVMLDCMVYHVFVWCTVYVCRGHTRLRGVPCVCLVYRLRLSWSYSIAWCTMCLFGVPFRLSWSYSIVWCTMCLFGVPFTSVVVILDCVVYHVFVWCTVSSVVVILDCMVYHVFGSVYRLRLSWSYSIAWCTMCLVRCTVYVCRGHTRLRGVPCVWFGVPFTSVVVILDCVVYHVFGSVYRLRLSEALGWGVASETWWGVTLPHLCYFYIVII